MAWAEAYLRTKLHLGASRNLATTDMGRVFLFGGGGCAPWGGAGSASNTMLPGPRPTSIPSGILIHPAVWPQQTWAENWGCYATFWGGALGPHLTQCRLGRSLPSYQVASCKIHPAIWPQQIRAENCGDCAPLGKGELSLNVARAYSEVKMIGIWSS